MTRRQYVVSGSVRVLRRPIVGAVLQKIEHPPRRAVVVAGTEEIEPGADDRAVVKAMERRHPGLIIVLAIFHVEEAEILREWAIGGRRHPERPVPRGRECL